jgi:uncharacterized protein YggT (Ycf19 family)
MLFFAASLAKMWIEIAALSVVAQGIVGIFSTSQRELNPIYRLFGVVTKPINALVRRITPAFVVDKHIAFVSFFYLAVLWVCALVLKVMFAAQAAT